MSDPKTKRKKRSSIKATMDARFPVRADGNARMKVEKKGEMFTTSLVGDEAQEFVAVFDTETGAYKTVALSDISGGAGGDIQSIVAGDYITVDDADPANPVVSGTNAFPDIEIADPAGKIEWAPFDSDKGPFIAKAALSIDGSNPHIYSGYNVEAGSIDLVNPDDRGLILGFETDYAEPGIAPHRAMEWYIQYQFESGFGPAGDPHYTRMLMGQIDKTTNLPTVHYQASAGIGFKWGWLDGTGTDEQKVVGKTKMALTDEMMQVYAVPGGDAPILTLDSQAASAATGVNITSRASGSGVHVFAVSPNPNEALYINGKGVGGVVVGLDSGRGLVVLNGSASAPSYSFVGDQDAGWYLKAAGNFTGSIGGVDVVDVTSSGQTIAGKAWGTQGVGVPSGAGGKVIQATSKSTTVILHKASGEITMNNAALAAGAAVTFTFGNSLIEPADVLAVNVIGGTDAAYVVNAKCANGGANMYVRNITTGSLSEAIILRYVLLKSATS